MERRVLAINPNSDQACTDGIAAALAPFARPGALRFDVMTLTRGPPAVASWRDWYSVAIPLCDAVQAEPASAYILACVSDPGLEAVREVTSRPVFGPFRCAVASALARAERFGIIAFVEASKARQRRALQAMGVEARLAATEALNLPMTTLTDPIASRPALIAAARRLAGAGSEVIVLGCAGLAPHRAAVEEAIGRPVIEPIAAAGAMAALALES